MAEVPWSGSPVMDCNVGSVSHTVPCSRPHCCLHNATSSLPATSKALLTSLLISIISTHRSHIRRPFDGTIRRASLEYVLVPTAVSITRRALSPCDVEGSLISIISTYRSHIRRPFDGTIRRLYIGHTFPASE